MEISIYFYTVVFFQIHGEAISKLGIVIKFTAKQTSKPHNMVLILLNGDGFLCLSEDWKTILFLFSVKTGENKAPVEEGPVCSMERKYWVY